jgi:hypothetical protein
MTAWISSSVAVGFITIIISCPLWCLENDTKAGGTGFTRPGGFSALGL